MATIQIRHADNVIRNADNVILLPANTAEAVRDKNADCFSCCKIYGHIR